MFQYYDQLPPNDNHIFHQVYTNEGKVVKLDFKESEQFFLF